jgi:8-oxo-dGTP diphosphatase
MLVVGAVIIRDGRVLAGLRPGRGWEFPGGKVEPDESAADALIRECREELGVTVAPVRALGSAADGALVLQLWLARLVDGDPATSTDHSELRWVGAPDFDDIDWLALDRNLLPLVRALLG